MCKTDQLVQADNYQFKKEWMFFFDIFLKEILML